MFLSVFIFLYSVQEAATTIQAASFLWNSGAAVFSWLHESDRKSCADKVTAKKNEVDREFQRCFDNGISESACSKAQELLIELADRKGALLYYFGGDKDIDLRTGHVHKDNQYYPLVIHTNRFWYGIGTGTDETNRATDNLMRLCKKRELSECAPWVDNSEIGYDKTIGGIAPWIDPVQGKNKILRGSYSCVNPINGKVVSTHNVLFPEGNKGFLSCRDKDPTIFM